MDRAIGSKLKLLEIVTSYSMPLAHNADSGRQRCVLADEVVVQDLRVIAVTQSQLPLALVEEVVAEDVTTTFARDNLALTIASIEVAILDHTLGLLLCHIACADA